MTIGQLPPGLALNPTTGVIGGTPTSTLPTTFGVTVKDSANTTSPQQFFGIPVGPLVTYPGQSETVIEPRVATSGQLLFPYLTTAGGYDTMLTISNTSQDTVGTTPQSGACTLSFYQSGLLVSQQTSGTIAAGQQLVFNLSQGAGVITGVPNFSGYGFADCTFPQARGSASAFYTAINEGFSAAFKTWAEEAQVITTPRVVSTVSTNLLFPFVTNANGFETGIAIANTSKDPFKTANQSGTCTLNFYMSGVSGATNPASVTAPNLTEGTNQPFLAGETYQFTLSQALAVNSSNPATFTGYMIAQCNFGTASIFSYLTSAFPGPNATAYSVPVETVVLPRDIAEINPHWILFPFVTSQNGNDTNIVISNTSSDPFGSSGAAPTAGLCTLNFYGPGAPPAFVTPTISAGTVYTTLASNIASGFQGYMIAQCNFASAHGLAIPLESMVTITLNGVPIDVPTNPATPTHLLFDNLTNQNGNDTQITISNTSADPLGTPPASGACTISYFGSMIGGGNPPSPQVSSSIPAGGQLNFTLSQGNASQGIAGAQGLLGYGIADCAFPLAVGVAEIIELVVQTTTLPGGFVGAIYAQTLVAANGAPPYNNWTVSAGSLPSGLSLDPATGIIHGYPTTTTGSPFSFGVTFQDSTGNTSVARALSIAIGPENFQTISFAALSDLAPTATPPPLSATASSGLTPVTFTSNTTSVCTVSGTTVTLKESGGCSITANQAGNTTYAPAPPVTQEFTVLFNDVPPNASYAAAVDLFAQYGITSGCGNDDFCANTPVTRAEMAVFIITGIFRGASFSYSTTPHFADVPASGPGSFGFKFIQAMYELGITAGCAKAVPPSNLPSYCPNNSLTRAQMAVFIMVARFGGANFTYSSMPSFADVPDSGATASIFQFVQRMKQDGITGGCAKAVAPAILPSYCPGETVSRAQMAVFMMVGLFNQFLPAGTPLITGISPSVLPVGTSGTFAITGVNTSFAQGTTTLSPIPGVTIGTITVNSATSLTVQLTAAANATPRPYTIEAITGSEQDVLPNSLIVQ